MTDHAKAEQALDREIRPLRVGLYLLMVLSLVAFLFLEPALAGAVQRGALASPWLFMPLAFYGVFVVVYAIDRYLLVKRRRYPAGRAFFQVSFGVVFGLVLLPSSISYWRTAKRPTGGVSRLLEHPDPEVRLVTVEALAFRGFDRDRVTMLVPRLEDRDERVQAAAVSVLGRWAGDDDASANRLKNWASNLGSAGTSSAAIPEGGR